MWLQGAGSVNVSSGVLVVVRGNGLIRKTSTSTSEVALDSVHFSDEETETQTFAQDELVIERR